MRNSPKSAPENNAYTENAAKQFCMKKTNVIFKTAHMSLGIEQSNILLSALKIPKGHVVEGFLVLALSLIRAKSADFTS